MKATKFSKQLAEAGITIAMTGGVGGGPEPRVIVRQGRDGQEHFLSTIKVRNDPKMGPLIILEWGSE